MSITSNSNLSANNPNRLSERHLDRKSINSLNDLNKSKLESSSSASLKMFDSSGFEDEVDDPDHIDYYLKLKSKQSDLNFQSIHQNFNSSHVDTTLTKHVAVKDDFQENFLKMFDTSNQNKLAVLKLNAENSQENQSVPIIMTSQAKNVSQHLAKNTLAATKTSPNHTEKTIEKAHTVPNKVTEPLDVNSKQSREEEKNPFLESEKNPFLENSDNETIIKQNTTATSFNPFLDSGAAELDAEMIISSPPQLESTVKCFSKDDQSENSNKQENLNKSNTTTTKFDLLEWCKDIVKRSKHSSPLFKNLVVNDFSSSWTSGLAFCAIIHNFKPNLM